MFPTFIGILDIQSWWEVPSIAYFCFLFENIFNLLNFDIEELEEALLSDSSREGYVSQELIVKFLKGCLRNGLHNDISMFNYQMFLRRLFRKKCQEESLKNLDFDSLRIKPLGYDRENSVYWYFYGTRLYRKDYLNNSNIFFQKQKKKTNNRKFKKCESRLAKKKKEKEKVDLSIFEAKTVKESIWQVVCFSLQSWNCFIEKLRNSENTNKRNLYKTLSKDFMTKIPKLFDLKEKQQRRNILQYNYPIIQQQKSKQICKGTTMVKNKVMPKTSYKKTKKEDHLLKNEKSIKKKELDLLLVQPGQKKGRQTNNSLASAIGQIVIEAYDRTRDSEEKKVSGKQSSNCSTSYDHNSKLGIEDEEQRVGMFKILNILKEHEDAWPFVDPVDEQYAPRYYSVVRRPMDFNTMEKKLEEGSYKSVNQFKRDFRLIIDNCKQYNGSDNEYTEMARNLQTAFEKAINKYLEDEHSSDDSSSTISNVDENSKNHPISYRDQRNKNFRKSNKKSKLNNGVSNKRINRKYLDAYIRENNEIKTKKEKAKRKNFLKIDKYKCKENTDNNEKQEMKGKICDGSVVKSTKTKNINSSEFILNNEKPIMKNENSKSKSKIKTEIDQNTGKKYNKKKLKKDSKRKKDIKDNECIIVSKSKCRKIDENVVEKSMNIVFNETRRKRKKECQKKSLDEVENTIILDKKGKKYHETDVNNLTSFVKRNKNKIKKFKKEKRELIDNNKSKSLNSDKNVNKSLLVNKVNENKIEAFVSDQDIESLDSLKDRISEKCYKEKLKLMKEKEKKLFESHNQNIYTKKVPSNNSIFAYEGKIDRQKLKLKKSSMTNKKIDNQSLNQGKNEPKKVKIHKKNVKGYGEKNQTIVELNKATEQTLNDINKWLDDAPCLSKFSTGKDILKSPTSTNDSLQLPTIKETTVAMTVTGMSVKTGTSLTIDSTSRKRIVPQKCGVQNKMKLKKVHRTINRLQPGKSKGNLLSKKTIRIETGSNTDVIVNQMVTDSEQTNHHINNEPKLSLGTVLKNVESIQLICKSLVSSPNTNDEDDNEDVSFNKLTFSNSILDEPSTVDENKSLVHVIEEEKNVQVECDEPQKSKSVTPNLSAWFKAFGTPKQKKKEEEEEEEEESVKKDEPFESIGINSNLENRQRRTSVGGSSVSESVSSFSQESPPSQISRSPQQMPQLLNATLSPSIVEPQIRCAGFYQDALSTNSSPYSSPYYTTPPRYSAQLPPTPSPQHHPLSPACNSNFEQTALVSSPKIYSQMSPQSYQTLKKSSPQRQSPNYCSKQSSQNCFQQNFPHHESQQPKVLLQVTSPNQNQSPVHSKQQSPQPLRSSSFLPVSEHDISYSQLSPQSPIAVYSQSSPKSLLSLQEMSSNQRSSAYSEPSSPGPSYSNQTPSPYFRTESNQVSSEIQGNLQSTKQLKFSTSSSKTSPYLDQASLQQKSSSNSQSSSEILANYSQLSIQDISKISKFQSVVNNSQSVLKNTIQQQQQQLVVTESNIFNKVSQDISNNLREPQVNQSALASAVTIFPKVKLQQNPDKNMIFSNQISSYSSSTNMHYPSSYPGDIFPANNQISCSERNTKSAISKMSFQDMQQIIQQKQIDLSQEPQTQLLDFQKNVGHDALYATSFQTITNPVTNPVRHPGYTSYFESNTKHTSVGGSLSSLTPVKKRIYNEKSSPIESATIHINERAGQEQFGFETLMTLAHSQSDIHISNQIDSAFNNSVSDSVAVSPNSAFTRLQLELVNRNSKEAHQLLSMSRQKNKSDVFVAYSRNSSVDQTDFELNLCNLQSVSTKNSDTLTITRKTNDQLVHGNICATKTKKSKKPKQHQQPQQHKHQKQQQPINSTYEQQIKISGFSQYGGAADCAGMEPSTVESNCHNLNSTSRGTNNQPYFEKEPPSSAASVAYAFLDDFRGPNLPSYYSMALRQQEQQQHTAPTVIQQQQLQQQTDVQITSTSKHQIKLNDQAIVTSNYSNHSFLHCSQTSSPYSPTVPAYVTPHSSNLSVDPSAYQQYLHSLYALQPPSHHRPSWI